MFDSLRDRIHTVQQDISASFRNLTVGDNASRNAHSVKSGASVNAGAELLRRYQNNWKDLHETAEENATKAEAVDAVIGSLHESCETQWQMIGQLNSQLALLPALNQSIVQLMGKIGQLENFFEEVELAIVNLEDIIELQELQEKQLDSRFQLALYKEKKLAEFEELKVHSAMDHAQKVKDFDQRQQALLKERQEIFKEAFEEEMQHYKTHGQVERVPSLGSEQALQLEEVELDDDISVLDEFLSEDRLEDILLENALAEAIDDEDPPEETKVAT